MNIMAENLNLQIYYGLLNMPPSVVEQCWLNDISLAYVFLSIRLLFFSYFCVKTNEHRAIDIHTSCNAGQNMIDVFERWCYRRMLHISWTEHVTDVVTPKGICRTS